MPIRAEMKALYPKNWKEIRASILERADNACECDGQCGHRHPMLVCCAPNRSHVTWFESGEETKWLPFNFAQYDTRGVREPIVEIVLTIAHLDHDPTNNDPSNLRAMCQRCHLRYDSKEHQKNAAETRRKKHEKLTGQKRLF